MISNRLSRWTLWFFACALVNFVAAQALVIAGVSWPAQSWAAPGTLIGVHLVTIGWLLLLMLGALFQFVPVMTSKTLPSQHLALATLVCVQLGLIAMICGFAALGQGNPVLARCLPAGGALVIVGVLLGIGDIAVPLLRARPLPLPGRMVLTAIAFLLATITLGLLMAIALSVPALAPWATPLLGGVGYHALAGLGGWFTIAAVGVSYKLLPMFMLAPEERGAVGEIIHYLIAAGFGIALIAGLVGLWQPTDAMDALEWGGYALVVVALGLYLVDVIRLYRTRKRAAIELHNKAAIGAFGMLALSTVAGIVIVATDSLIEYLPILIFLTLFGWLAGLGLAQLYKIVPFLTWIGQFGQSLGRGRVPRVQDLVIERRGAPWFIVYFAAVLLAVFALLGPGANLFRVASVLMALATVMLVREYWRAWRGYYVERQPAPGSTPPPFTNTEISK